MNKLDFMNMRDSKKGILTLGLLICFMFLYSNPVFDLLEKKGGKLKFPNNDFVVLFDSINVDVFETGLGYFTYHKLTQVLTEAGAKRFAILTKDYDPLNAYVEFRKVIIYRKNGSKEIIDKKKIYDYAKPARAIYWGARQIMLEIGKLEPGDAIEEISFKKGFTYALLNDNETVSENKFVPPMQGHFYDIIPFWSKSPIIKKVYSVNVPKTKKLQYKFYRGESILHTEEINDKIRYVFTVNDIKPLETESRSLSPFDFSQKLIVSTTGDWTEKSTWFYGVNEDYGSFNSTPDIDKKVKELLLGAKDENDSVARLTHWVADEIRYSGLSMGEGEGFTLHTGEMTFSDRCGVCKDKAGMLITMLRAAGFESYPAMTMAGSRIDQIPADHFNHCVTAVRLSDGKLHVLDPTWVPFLRELWSSAEQQQNYLIGTAEGDILMESPLSPAENHYLYIDGNSEILNDGTYKALITVTAEGQSDGALRKLFLRSERRTWQSNFEQQMLLIAPNIIIDSVNYGNPWDYSSPAKFVFSIRIPDFAYIDDKVLIFNSVTASDLFKGAQYHLNFDTEKEKRNIGFKDRCSRLVKINESIKLPGDYTVEYLPASEEVNGEYSSFKGGYELADQSIKLSQTIKLNKRVYEAKDWPIYKKAVQGQKTLGNKIILNKK